MGPGGPGVELLHMCFPQQDRECAGAPGKRPPLVSPVDVQEHPFVVQGGHRLLGHGCGWVPADPEAAPAGWGPASAPQEKLGWGDTSSLGSPAQTLSTAVGSSPISC